MDNLPLSTEDFQEILSSLLLAELPYNDRMSFCRGTTLIPEFVPTTQNLPNLESITDTIRTMFNVPLADLSVGATLSQWAARLCEQWETAEQKITFFTSGSTGAPKPTTHDFVLHTQEVHALARLFKDRKRVVSFVPRHHIYGFLFSILLPKALGCEIKWEVPLPTPGLVDSLADGDLVVAFPLLWGKLREMNVRFSTGIHGVTSTGPCPAETIQELRTNGLDAMFEIYGSSETGGVGYRSNPKGGYTLLEHWARTDDDACLIRRHPLRGDEKHVLQDILQWQSPTTFIPMRRTDDAVQVAGINVYPSRVRDILLEHPDVKECAVRLMRPDEGSRLKIVIVPQSTCQSAKLESILRQWAKNRLSPCEQPASWTLRKRLPVNELGKLKDW